MDALLDLVGYRWPLVPVASMVCLAVVCGIMYTRQRSMYRSWLEVAEAPFSTRFLARVGLFGSLGFLVLAWLCVFVAAVLLLVDEATLREWTRAGIAWAQAAMAARGY